MSLPRNVIFVAPFPMETTMEFAVALAKLRDIRLLGVWQEPPPPRIFDDVVVVESVMDARGIAEGVQELVRRYGPAHRILGIMEDLQEPLAEVRQHFGVQGADLETAHNFRDKSRMKDVLRAHGIPCARHRLLHSREDAQAFVREVGFPQVLKPPDGSGTRNTFRVDNVSDIEAVLQLLRPSPARPVLAEEFILGAEWTFETFTTQGVPRFHSITRYYPNPLEVVQNPWMQLCIVAPRDISGPEFEPVRQLAPRVVAALGLHSGLTHMEWFQRPDGTIAVGEIAARPPGTRIVKLTEFVHDMDVPWAWARAVVDDAFDGPWARRSAAGVCFLRGLGEGRVVGLDGLDEAQQAVGDLVVETKLPRPGQPKKDGYEGEGVIYVRHPDTEVVKRALLFLIENLRVRYA